MRKALLWFGMLSKRLFKKGTYLCLLMLIPLLVVGFAAGAKEESGMVRILLVQEDPQDAFSTQIVEELMGSSEMILFAHTSEAEAFDQIKAGKADAAWIIPGDLQTQLAAVFLGQEQDYPPIRVIEQSESALLRLTHEKLSSTVYKYWAEEMYLQYLQSLAPEAATISRQELTAFYHSSTVSGTLFEYTDIYGNARSESSSYLVTPLRGILAVLVALCSVVSGIYYRKDTQRGLFSTVSFRHRPFIDLGYQFTSVFYMAFAVLIALIAAGLTGPWWAEVMLFFLGCFGCTLFGTVFSGLTGGRYITAALLPVLLVLMLAICPVFYHLPQLRYFQFLFPATYYITGAHHYAYICYYLLYDIILAVLWLLIKHKKQYR